jgi:topoisomerase-4 subunit A
VDTLLAFGSNGRVYSIPVSVLPGARGDGQPLTTFLDLESGTQLVHYFAGAAAAWLLLSNSGGYGFIATVENMMSRQKGGKAVLSLGAGEAVCRPSPANVPPQAPATHVCCASVNGRILTFDISELKAMANGGRGLMLIDLEPKDSLAGAAAYVRSVKISGIGRGGKERDETLEIRSLNNAKAGRGRKGKAADLGFKPLAIERIE